MASEQIIRWIREHLAVISVLADREQTPETKERLHRNVKAVDQLLSQLNVTVTCPLKESCPVHVAMIAEHENHAAAHAAAPDPNPAHVRRGD